VHRITEIEKIPEFFCALGALSYRSIEREIGRCYQGKTVRKEKRGRKAKGTERQRKYKRETNFKWGKYIQKMGTCWARGAQEVNANPGGFMNACCRMTSRRVMTTRLSIGNREDSCTVTMGIRSSNLSLRKS
jgi:hypothetical protein